MMIFARTHLILAFALAIFATAAAGQSVEDSSRRTIGHITSSGTVEDKSRRTIGHAKGIKRDWAAAFFFFFFRPAD